MTGEKNKLYTQTGRFTIDMDTGEMKLFNGIDEEMVEYDGSGFETMYEEVKKLADAQFLPADIPEKFADKYKKA